MKKGDVRVPKDDVRVPKDKDRLLRFPRPIFEATLWAHALPREATPA